jgi:aromatic ring-cleaving dioxygenase
MSARSIGEIQDWHAHVYFDADSREAAQALRTLITETFAGDMEMGRFHERPVGPHPRWSYQVAFGNAALPRIVPWLALNRGDLVVFIHPNTGQALEDHRDHAIWLGTGIPLNLEALS